MPGEWPSMPLVNSGRLLSLATVPICAYIGYNGMGKSALAAAVAMQHADAGRPVLGSARLLDWRNPRPCPDNGVCEWPSHGEPGHMAAHPMWRGLTDYRQLFTFRDGHIWADEATGIADARGHQSMPGELNDYLPRMRAKQVTFHWTTIHWSFADTRLRRLTWAAVWATGLMPKYVGDEIWGRNRLFYYRAYDAKNLSDDFDLTKRNSAQSSMSEVKAMIRGWVWGPSWNAWQGYSSLDAPSTLGGTDESGMCMTCGGNRGRKKCPGHDVDGSALPAPSRRRRSDSDDHALTTPVHDDTLGAPIPPASGPNDLGVPDGVDLPARVEVRRPRERARAGGDDGARLRAAERPRVPRVPRAARREVRDDPSVAVRALRDDLSGSGHARGPLGDGAGL